MTTKDIQYAVERYRKSNWSQRRILLLELRALGGNPALEAFACVAHLDPHDVINYAITVLRRRHCTAVQKRNFPEPEPPKMKGEFKVDAAEAKEFAVAVAGPQAEERYSRRDSTKSKSNGVINPQRHSRKMDSSQAQERALPENMHIVSFRR